VPHGQPAPPTPIWVKRDLVLFECPRSFITGQSASLLERYALRKRWGDADYRNASAKEVEAFLILDAEMESEERQRDR